MKKSLVVWGVAAIAVLGTSWADESGVSGNSEIADLKKTIQELDQKVRILERQNEVASDTAAEKAKTLPTVTIGDKGFGFESADKKFSLTLHGLLQADSRWYANDGGIGGGSTTNDSFVLRRVRPVIQGKVYDNYEFLITPEFGGGSASGSSSVSILDAFVNVNYWKEFQVRAGKFKTPIGLEVLQSDPYRTFAENSLVSDLVPNRDVGVDFHGDIGDKLISYDLAAFNGSIDSSSAGQNADYDDEKEIVGRVFAQPFRATDINELRGFGFGAAYSFGNEEGSLTNPRLASYATEGQETFFSYRNTANTTTKTGSITYGDGDHWRFSPQGTYYYGPFGLLGEYVVSNQDLINNQLSTAGKVTKTRRGQVQNEAWEITTSYVLTGEDASFTGVTPRQPFSISQGTWGAWELAARYGELNIGRSAFTGAGTTSFADPTKSANRAASFGLGLNWYLNKNVRVTADYYNTDFAGGTVSKGSSLLNQNEEVFITRLQLYY